jgi:hypothetical protein
MSITSLLPLVPRREYLASRANVFGSDESLRWFERSNRQVLADRGAVVAPLGRKLINPELFDAVVLEVGAKRAAGKA